MQVSVLPVVVHFNVPFSAQLLKCGNFRYSCFLLLYCAFFINVLFFAQLLLEIFLINCAFLFVIFSSTFINYYVVNCYS